MTRNHIILHLIIFLLGFTGILGALITIDSLPLVGYRMGLAWLGLVVFYWLYPWKANYTRTDRLRYLGTGVVVAGHWIAFFEAIKVSNVSITLACLAATPLFVAFIEPLLYRRRIHWHELLFAGIVIAGLYLVFIYSHDSPAHLSEQAVTRGIIIALTAAFLAAIFTTLNGLLMRKHEPVPVTLYQMIGGTGVTVLYLFVTQGTDGFPIPGALNLFYLLLLGILCTSFAYAMSLKVMKTLSPFTVAISYTLEPVYAIVLALLIFGEKEHMSAGFYGGTLLILTAVAGDIYWKRG
jgi:drug/metabolite transporter (DMT)-like permease